MLGGFFEELQLQGAQPLRGSDVHLHVGECGAQKRGIAELRGGELRMVFLDSGCDSEPGEGLAEVEVLALVGNRCRAQHALRHVAEHRLRQVHEIAVIAIGLIELEHGEFRIVPGGDALVAEIAVDLEHLLQPADNKAFQI